MRSQVLRKHVSEWCQASAPESGTRSRPTQHRTWNDRRQHLTASARCGHELVMQYCDIEKAFDGSGLICRGGFRPGLDDGVPGPAGAAAVVKVGNAGPMMWREFTSAVDAERRQTEANPLNDWTRIVVDSIAAEVGARALYPFDGPPYLPFHRWAMRTGAVHSSPIGLLIDPVYGLWHAYRAALVFADGFDLLALTRTANPCDSCTEKPCLNTCPVTAFSDVNYDVPACAEHIAALEGSDCLAASCRARRACPVGRDFIYAPDQARFHMERFLRAVRKRRLNPG